LLILCFAGFERHALQTRGSYFVYERQQGDKQIVKFIYSSWLALKATRYKRAGTGCAGKKQKAGRAEFPQEIQSLNSNAN
jgi:hypothetical protein